MVKTKILIITTLFVLLTSCGVKKEPAPLYSIPDPVSDKTNPTPTPVKK